MQQNNQPVKKEILDIAELERILSTMSYHPLQPIRPILLICLLVTLASIIQSPADEKTSDKIYRLKETLADPKGKNWVVKAFSALALKDIPDSRCAEALGKMLLEPKPNQYLISFALSGLKEFPPEVLQGALNVEVIDALIKKWFSKNNESYNEYIIQILGKIGPKAEKNTYSYWNSWWEKEKKTYQKKPPVIIQDIQVAAPVEKEASGQTRSVIMRLAQLEKEGLDLALIVDATGSMGPYIDQTKKEIQRMYRIFKEVIPDFRFAIVAYWDNAMVWLPLTSDQAEIVKRMKSMGAAGGDDWAEGIDKALDTALFSDKMPWREQASKVLIIIGDASPHSQDIDKMCKLAEDANKLQLKKKPAEKVVVTGGGKQKPPGEPYVIHAMAVGAAVGPPDDPSATPENRDVLAVFKKIAESGGGVAMRLENKEEVVQQIMLLTFGKEWENEIKQFIQIFMKIIQAEEAKK